MTNKQMDEKIRDAFEAATPNVLGSILAQCAKQKRNITVFKQRRSIGWTRRFITVSAATILILVLVTGLIDRLPPIMPTGPLFTGTDPTGTNPTQPDALTWVDWGMNATWVLKNGTTQGQYPMQIKGLIENKKETRLKLEIYTPDSFGYLFTAPDDGYTPNALAGLVEQPGDYYDFSSTYSIKANKFVETHWAISTTKEYFIAYWPEKADMFLVGAGDPNVSAAEVMAYFDTFVEEFRTEEPKPTDPKPTDPQPTDPDNKINVDWSMNASWVWGNGTLISKHATTVRGTVVNNADTTYLDLSIDAGQKFPYQFILPEPNGYAAGTRLIQAEGDYNTAGYVQDVATKETVWSAWAISTQKEYFIFMLPGHPDKFLVGATDPNVTAKQILDYFDLFVDHYLPDPVDPIIPEPDILDRFPENINTDTNTLAVFQELFSYESWFAQALYADFDDPRDMDLHNYFYGVTFQDEEPLTQEERDAIVAMSGREDCSWMDGARFPVEKMNRTLQEVFGISLDDMHDDTLWAMHYLESTDSYYYFNSGSKHVGRIHVVGTKTLKNGNIAVYYTRGYELDPTEHGKRGVVTLKPAGDSYHILSNYYSEDGTWPEEETTKPIDPSILAQFPEDLVTDPAILAKMENLLSAREGEINYYNQALLSFYDIVYDVDFEKLFYNTIPGQEPITAEEKAALKTMGFKVDQPIQRIPLEELYLELPFLPGHTYFMSAWMAQYPYISTNSAFYFNHSDTLRAGNLHVVGVRMVENVTQVYYVYNGDVAGVVTLYGRGYGYDIYANHRLGTEPELQQVQIPDPFPQDLTVGDNFFMNFAQWFAYEGSWFKHLLSQTYNSYEEISLSKLFSHGFADEHPVTAAELAALQLSEKEKQYPGVRLPVKKMDKVLRRSVGAPLSYMPEEAFAGLHYLEETDCYYYFGEPAKVLETIQVIGYRKGSNDVYYVDTATGIMGVVRVNYGVHSMKASRNAYYENGVWPEFKVTPSPTYDVQIPEDLSTDATVMDQLKELFCWKPNTEFSIWNMALTHVYEDPSEISLEELFYNGVYNSSGVHYKVSWEDYCKLRDEHDFMEDVSATCLPPEEMNKVVQELFGITLDDLRPQAFHGLAYLETTGYYYINKSDAGGVEALEILGYRMLEDGSMEVYYYSDAEYPEVQGVITLQPHGDSYRILSNIYSEKK